LRRALEGVALVRADGPGAAAQILARDALEASAAIPNLRQGAFAPSGERGAGRSGNAWRIAAIFGAAAILAQAAAQGVSGWRDRQTAAGVEADARAQFRAMAPAFPEGGDVLAAVRALAAGAERAETHPVLRVSPSLTEALKAEPRVRLDSLAHRPGEKGVEVTLSTTAPEALPALIAALRAKRLAITEAPPASGPIRVTQTLKLEPGP
jgi:type II secretory pathway component PulL